jgi:hypothetical protein
MPAKAPPLTELLGRIRGEYLEMPGLKLTLPQAQRLWGLDRAMCEAALAELEQHHFLRRTLGGAFVRAEHAA